MKPTWYFAPPSQHSGTSRDPQSSQLFLACSPAQSAAVSAIPGVVFSGSVDGHLRGYSTATGEILWDTDTAHEFQTVNGQAAQGGSHGGSMDAAGPAVVNGMVFVNSGYGQWGGMPGNVLLAFSINGK